MTFNPAVPRPTDLLSKSQGDLLTNNSNLNAIFSRNHIPLNIATNFGKHSFIEMVNSNPVGSPPTPALSTGVGVAYTKSVSTYSATTESEIFYTPDTTGKQYQLTRTINGQFSLFATNTNYQAFAPPKPSQFGGWSFLPGGLLIQYGTTANTNLNSNFQIVYPIAFTSFVGSVVITAYDSVSTDKSFVINSGSVNLTGFKFRLSSSNQPEGAYWIAIGQ